MTIRRPSAVNSRRSGPMQPWLMSSPAACSFAIAAVSWRTSPSVAPMSMRTSNDSATDSTSASRTPEDVMRDDDERGRRPGEPIDLADAGERRIAEQRRGAETDRAGRSRTGRARRIAGAPAASRAGHRSSCRTLERDSPDHPLAGAADLCGSVLMIATKPASVRSDRHETPSTQTPARRVAARHLPTLDVDEISAPTMGWDSDNLRPTKAESTR